MFRLVVTSLGTTLRDRHAPYLPRCPHLHSHASSARLQEIAALSKTIDAVAKKEVGYHACTHAPIARVPPCLLLSIAIVCSCHWYLSQYCTSICCTSICWCFAVLSFHPHSTVGWRSFLRACSFGDAKRKSPIRQRYW